MILFEIKDGVGKICLNRPEKFHSVVKNLALELQKKLDECATHEDVQSVAESTEPKLTIIIKELISKI